MFINFSNHPSTGWSSIQRIAAERYGAILDIPFPGVSATAKTEEITKLADYFTQKILHFHPDCVMCQGEFTLTVAVVRRLQESGVLCVCACSERKSMEEYLSDNITKKTAMFEFVQFRAYESMKVK